MVPVERIELPTFGLQNRCSTAELNRRIEATGEGKDPPRGPFFGGSNIRLDRKGPEPPGAPFTAPAWKRRPFSRLFRTRFAAVLLAEMLPAVFAADQGARDTDITVAAGIGFA